MYRPEADLSSKNYGFLFPGVPFFFFKHSRAAYQYHVYSFPIRFLFARMGETFFFYVNRIEKPSKPREMRGNSVRK